eukprot:738028-Pyramimonas_sp.AAC.1
MPTSVHLCGFSLLVVLFYAHASVEFSGINSARFAKLGAFLSSVKLPWLVMGEFHIDVAKFQGSAFCRRVGGATRRADVEYTCVGSA